nr:NVEALA domain-containing protein [uncultured Bacteroides sp.]
MKKKIFGLVFFVTFFVVAVLNINLSKFKNNGSDLILANVEALAQETNPWYLWPTQGLTKDERTVVTPCSITTTTTTTSPGASINVNVTVPVNGTPVGVSGGATTGSTVQVTTTQAQGTKIDCPSGGNSNCTPKACS